jgi:Gas vesicle protein
MSEGADRQVARSPISGVPNRQVVGASQPATLADLLERVLDKGIVIAGDITLSLGTVEVLTLKIRLLIASVDKAQEIGINWWQSDPALSSRAKALEEERDELKERLDRLEARLALSSADAAQEQPRRPRRSTRGSAGRSRSLPRRPPPPRQ